MRLKLNVVFSCALTLTISACGSGSNDQQAGGPGGGVGSACGLTSECSSGLVCAANVCATEGSLALGAQCSANRDCTAGLFCSLNGMCSPAGAGNVGDACVSGTDCDKSLVCNLPALLGSCQTGGVGDLGATCASNDECLAGLACSPMHMCKRSVEAYPPFAGVACAADESPFRGYFEVPRSTAALPDFFRLPFPNDIRVASDGHLALDDFPRPGPSPLGDDLVDLYANVLQTDFEGFSSVAPVLFRFSSEIDFATLDGNAVHLADITDPLATGYGVDIGRRWGYDTGSHEFVCQNSLALSNNMFEPLLPGHTYVAWISTAVRSAAGAPPAQDPDLIAVLDSAPPADPDLAAAWTQYAKFRDYLVRTSRTSADVATAAVFTTADHSRIARALDTQVEAGPLPTLSDLTVCDGIAVSPCNGEDGRVCGNSSGDFWEVHGKVSVPNYQAGTLPYEKPADGGGITLDGAKQPVAQGALEVCFAMTIPKGSAPADGWPMVVHGHGTGGSFKSAITDGIAETLATASTPMATLTFDGVGHGARRGGSSRTPENLVFNLTNPRAARDNHLQGAVDVIQMLRVAQIAPFAVPPGVGGGPGTVDFDASKVYYFGHSQGSNVGIPAIAVTDLAPAAVFSGAGSVLTEGMLTRTSPVDIKAGLELRIGESLNREHPVMTLLQTFLDRSDPINYAPLLIGRPLPGKLSKHVMEIWGKGDAISSESTMNNTAIAAGLLQAAPVVTPIGSLAVDPRPIQPQVTAGDGSVRFGAVFQYDPAGAFDSHFVAQQSAAAVSDWKAFLVSLAAGVPFVP